MKKHLSFTLLLFLNPALAAQSPADPAPQSPRILVACFSATGNTAETARRLASVTGGDLFAIEPAQPYTAADLDWHNSRSRSSVEMKNPDSRPELAAKNSRMSDYDIVFIGFPIWWNLAPTIINTFIESHDLSGKTVIPFATSGGSGISHSSDALKRTYPDLRWKEGRLLNRADEQTIRTWVESLGL